MNDQPKSTIEDSSIEVKTVIDSDESFRKRYFPQAFAKEQRERDSGVAIGCELSRESAVLIRSAFSR